MDLNIRSMEKKEFLYKEEQKQESYKLLSECYYLPDESLLNSLQSSGRSTGSLYHEIAKHIPTANAVQSLSIDYSRLFVGPYELLAPPYGSVYMEDNRRLMGNSTMDIQRKYAQEGLNVCLKEAPDHIAIELEFLYYLISKEVEASLISDPVSANRYFIKRKGFLETHLGVWVSDFADNVSCKTETEFYKNLAQLTKSFVTEDLRSLTNTPTLAFNHV